MRSLPEQIGIYGTTPHMDAIEGKNYLWAAAQRGRVQWTFSSILFWFDTLVKLYPSSHDFRTFVLESDAAT